MDMDKDRTDDYADVILPLCFLFIAEIRIEWSLSSQRVRNKGYFGTSVFFASYCILTLSVCCQSVFTTDRSPKLIWHWKGFFRRLVLMVIMEYGIRTYSLHRILTNPRVGYFSPVSDQKYVLRAP